VLWGLRKWTWLTLPLLTNLLSRHLSVLVFPSSIIMRYKAFLSVDRMKRGSTGLKTETNFTDSSRAQSWRFYYTKAKKPLSNRDEWWLYITRAHSLLWGSMGKTQWRTDRSLTVVTPASYSGGLWFKSQPGWSGCKKFDSVLSLFLQNVYDRTCQTNSLYATRSY
jgi:hypothetical protein